jgi:hypothetical protein
MLNNSLIFSPLSVRLRKCTIFWRGSKPYKLNEEEIFFSPPMSFIYDNQSISFRKEEEEENSLLSFSSTSPSSYFLN